MADPNEALRGLTQAITDSFTAVLQAVPEDAHAEVQALLVQAVDEAVAPYRAAALPTPNLNIQFKAADEAGPVEAAAHEIVRGLISARIADDAVEGRPFYRQVFGEFIMTAAETRSVDSTGSIDFSLVGTVAHVAIVHAVVGVIAFAEHQGCTVEEAIEKIFEIADGG